MKKSKYQQYFHCFIVCIQGPYIFWFSFQQNIVTILISAIFAALIRGEALIRGRCLLGTYQRKYGKCTAVKTSPNLIVFINFERRITATRVTLKFQRYLSLEGRGGEKVAHSYINTGKEVKFSSPDHYDVNIILITFRFDTFIQLEFINVELF